MNVLLLSTYELGRQPFGLASPAAWLKNAGAQVTAIDLAIDHTDDATIQSANLVAIYVPMHTATRLAIPLAQRVKKLNPRAHLCFYGLYAPVNEKFLREIGADSIIGGEFENELVELFHRLNTASAFTPTTVSLARQKFLLPDRSGLPDASKYAQLTWDGNSSARTQNKSKSDTSESESNSNSMYLHHEQLLRPRAIITGYTEASHGCKHLCRHCPIVPVYGGQFRIVQKEIVLADIRQQVERGVQHITFGDPDFFNGTGHAIPIVRALHQEFPSVTYDVTIKVEHLLKHQDLLPALRDSGCAFVTSAIEAVDNRILQIFDKHHTREEFIRTVKIFRELGMVLQPTFVAFNPWISLEGYRDLLALVAELDLIDNVPSIQYAIRLLVPAGSRLLELPDAHEWLGAFDAERLCYTWKHRDARVDELQKQILGIVQTGGVRHLSRREIFRAVWEVKQESPLHPPYQGGRWESVSRPIPHLSEPWYC